MILGKSSNSSVLYNAINLFEETTCTKVIAGAIGGSVSLGLSNKSSDYDLYILYEKGKTDWHTKLSINSKESDCYSIAFFNCSSEVKTFLKTKSAYPSVIKRTLDQKTEDSRFGLLIEIFLNDSFYVHDVFFQSDYTSVKELFILKDVCDYWFTRAYANFHKFINKHQQVNIRKYLYTVWQCMYIFQALETRKTPLRDFIELFKSSKTLFDNDTLNSVLNLYHKNKNTSVLKNENFCEKQFDIEKWISQMLTLLEKEIAGLGNEKLFIPAIQ